MVVLDTSVELPGRADVMPETMNGLPVVIEAPSEIVSRTPVLFKTPRVVVEAISLDVERLNAPVGLSEEADPKATDVGAAG